MKFVKLTKPGIYWIKHKEVHYIDQKIQEVHFSGIYRWRGEYSNDGKNRYMLEVFGDDEHFIMDDTEILEVTKVSNPYPLLRQEEDNGKSI